MEFCRLYNELAVRWYRFDCRYKLFRLPMVFRPLLMDFWRS